MNIFIFCGPLAFGKGGMEKVAASLASYLCKKHKVTLGFFSRKKQHIPAYEVNSKVMLAPWNFKSEGSRFSYSKRIFETQPDVFIYFGASSQALQVISLLWKSDVPFVIHEGSNPERVITTNWASPRKISRYEAAWEREMVYGQAAAIRFTMPEYVDSLSFELKAKARAFPNAFNIPYTWHQSECNKRVINIGGLKPNKDIRPLIDVCCKLFKSFPDWELHIFSTTNKTPEGDAYVKEVERRISDGGLQENIFVHEEVDDIEKEYQRSDIHVITSLSEGLSNAVAESMTFGIPTVGIKGVPGVDGLVQHNSNGYLVDKERLDDELLSCLKNLISDSELRERLGEQARQDAMMFDPDTVYKEWEALIDFAIAQHKRKEKNEIERHCKAMCADFYKKVVKGFGAEIGKGELVKRLSEAKPPDEMVMAARESKAERERWLNE